MPGLTHPLGWRLWRNCGKPPIPLKSRHNLPESVTSVTEWTHLFKRDGSAKTEWKKPLGGPKGLSVPAIRERMVRMKGLEPSRELPHSDLNAARLPIPPHPHALVWWRLCSEADQRRKEQKSRPVSRPVAARQGCEKSRCNRRAAASAMARCVPARAAARLSPSRAPSRAKSCPAAVPSVGCGRRRPLCAAITARIRAALAASAAPSSAPP